MPACGLPWRIRQYAGCGGLLVSRTNVELIHELPACARVCEILARSDSLQARSLSPPANLCRFGLLARANRQSLSQRHKLEYEAETMVYSVWPYAFCSVVLRTVGTIFCQRILVRSTSRTRSRNASFCDAKI